MAHIGSATLNPGTVTISSVTAKIQDSAGNSLTSTAGALDVNASIDTTGLATDTGQTTGNGYLGTIAGAVSATHMQVDVLSAPTTAVTGTFWQATQPVSGTFYQATQPVSIASMPTTAVTGTFWQATQPVSGTVTANATLAAETTKVIGTVNIAAAQTIATTNAGTFAVQAAQSGTWNVGTVTAVTGITNALPAGTNAIGKLAANSGVDIGDVDVTSIAAGTNLVGDVDIQPRATGGWSVGNYTSGDTYTALTNGAQVIKASAGKFGGYYIYNPNTAATYVFIYNIAAASVTVGTSTAKLVFCIPASSGANLELLAGIPFDTAMSIAAATTGGGNTAPTTALECMVFFK